MFVKFQITENKETFLKISRESENKQKPQMVYQGRRIKPYQPRQQQQPVREDSGCPGRCEGNYQTVSRHSAMFPVMQEGLKTFTSHAGSYLKIL